MIQGYLNSGVYFPGDTLYCRVSVSPFDKKDSQEIEKEPNISIEEIDLKTKTQPPFEPSPSPSQLQNGFHEPVTTQNISTPKKTVVAWIAAQVHGYFQYEPNWVHFSDSTNQNPSQFSPLSSLSGNNHYGFSKLLFGSTPSTSVSTYPYEKKIYANKKDLQITTNLNFLPNLSSLGDSSRCIFETPPTILACDLTVEENQSFQYMYYCALPPILAPSFKGTGVRFSYYLTIFSQTLNNPTQFSRVPFKILYPAGGLKKIEITQYSINKPWCTPQQIGSLELPHNRFQEEVTKLSSLIPAGPSHSQLILRYDHTNTLQSVIALRDKMSAVVSFDISKGSEFLGRFSLIKTAYELGAEIKGSFDFTSATLPCFQYSVTLETLEEINPDILNPKRAKMPIKRIFGLHDESTINTLISHFIFYIPIDAPQSFSSNLVTVRWQLRFEFITPLTPHRVIQHSTSEERSGSSVIHVEPLVWECPLYVLVPSYPPELSSTPKTPPIKLL